VLETQPQTVSIPEYWLWTQKISACGGSTFCHLVIGDSRASGSGNMITPGYLNCLMKGEETSRSCELNPCRVVNAFFMKGF